jgi:hypothetical protein
VLPATRRSGVLSSIGALALTLRQGLLLELRW